MSVASHPSPTRSPALRKRADGAAAFALAGPATAAMVALILLPCLAVVAIAFTDWTLGAPEIRFVGVENFITMTTDPTVRAALFNTALYVAVVTPATLALGLLVALLIEAGSGMRATYRAIHFIPVMATLAATAIAWEALLHPTIGLVNLILAAMGAPEPNWLRDPQLVLFTLMVLGVWHHVGFAVVLFIAGLNSIPSDLYDAAAVDGADRTVDRFFTVTLPMLGPVIMFLAILVGLRALQTFDIVVILTQGGPGHASELLLHTLYVESFEFFRTGYGAALTVVFLLIVAALTLTQARVFVRRGHYS
ncbi:MAG: sugar ABC transporter permease [Pseudomonadota bacterium]